MENILIKVKSDIKNDCIVTLPPGIKQHKENKRKSLQKPISKTPQPMYILFLEPRTPPICPESKWVCKNNKYDIISPL